MGEVVKPCFPSFCHRCDGERFMGQFKPKTGLGYREIPCPACQGTGYEAVPWTELY